MADLNFNTLNITPEMFTYQEKLQNAWHPNGEKGITRSIFLNANPNMPEAFDGLDTNKDGIISETEYYNLHRLAGDDGILTDKERHDAAMQQARIFARRNVDKWFKEDKNRDGHASLVERGFWATFNNDGTTLEGEQTIEELTEIYGEPGENGVKHDRATTIEEEQETIEYLRAKLEDPNTSDEDRIEIMAILDSGGLRTLEGANRYWLNRDIIEIQKMFGVDLTEEDIAELQAEQNKQANNWLFKDGDGKDAPLYCQLSLDAYSRLLSTHNGESCCGGSICEIPDFNIEPIDLGNGKKGYTAKDMKARLAWASRTSIENIPEGATDRPDLGDGTVALMTDHQIEMYKKIVEEVTGQPWDSDGWVVTETQFHEIGARMNGTYGDETRLNGKTRADIPQNRQALLQYLEESGMLLPQFQK